MLKITLLKTLYYEIDESLTPETKITMGKDRHFRTLYRSYEICPEIQSVTVEERYLPYSILYYVWVNEEKNEEDLDNENLCRWILSFFQEYRPEYLKKAFEPDEIYNFEQLLECFDVNAIPSYRDNRAYSDLEITRMEDVRNGNVKKDNRKASFPGMTFSSKRDIASRKKG